MTEKLSGNAGRVLEDGTMEKVIFKRCRKGNTVEEFEVTVGTKIFVGRYGSKLRVSV